MSLIILLILFNFKGKFEILLNNFLNIDQVTFRVFSVLFLFFLKFYLKKKRIKVSLLYVNKMTLKWPHELLRKIKN